MIGLKNDVKMKEWVVYDNVGKFAFLYVFQMDITLIWLFCCDLDISLLKESLKSQG